MDELKNGGCGPAPEEGPPPIEFMYRGIPNLTCAEIPASGVMAADVVVVGCGGSGISAAVSAFERGAQRVVIIEKQKRAGGNAVMARGLFGCESSVLRRAMIKSDKDEIFTNAMAWHHHTRVNGRLIRAWINQSGETIDWLQKRDVEFEVGTTQRMTYDIAPHWHCVKGSTMATPMAHLVEELLFRGATFFTETLVEELLMEDGAVAGVQAVHEGKRFRIHAPSVVLASGGFLANTEMVQQYYPEYDPEIFGGYKAPNMGESVELARKAGALLDRDIMLIKEGCASSDRAPRILSEFGREPYLIWVNRKGRRYVDETVGSILQVATNAMMAQPGMESYVIFDEGTMHRMMDLGMELSKGDQIRGVPQPDLKEQFEQAAAKAPTEAKIAGTVEELAQWIGCQPETLQAELDSYNRYCAQGYDEDFNKPRKYLAPCHVGPFYGIRHRAIAVDTVGPVRVNEKLEVVNPDWDPIPGLYAAGSLTSGWQSNDYCGMYLFGGAMSYGINSGRIAGRNAAQHALG